MSIATDDRDMGDAVYHGCQLSSCRAVRLSIVRSVRMARTFGATVMMLILGPPYGAFLNWVRRRSDFGRGE